jgi:hypothetical protein
MVRLGVRQLEWTASMPTALTLSPSISPEPLGDITLAPYEMTKRSEAELADAMTQHLRAARPTSDSEALQLLRRAFPSSPLTLRVLALAGFGR